MRDDIIRLTNTFSASNPFDLISIDICGPLPQTQKLNRYIVTTIEKCSRYCLLIAVPDIKTISIIKAYQQWITLFGPPAYYPETNGQVERLHRWIKERAYD